MKNLIIFLITFLLITISYLCFFSCGKLTCSRYLKFEIPLTINPQKDTFNIGDTITIESSFSDRMIDLKTNETIEVKNFDFYTVMQLGQIDTEPIRFANIDFNVDTLKGGLRYYSFVISDTTQVGGQGGGYEAFFHYEKNTYVLNYRLYPKKKGTFYVAFYSKIPSSYYEADLIKNCHSSLTVDYISNNKQNNNYEFFATSPEPTIKNMTQQQYYRGGY
jgi:hypothetical protein